MEIQRLLAEFETGRERNLPLPAITGPLLGLVYFVAIPFLGFAALVYFMGQKSAQIAVSLWHRAAHPGTGYGVSTKIRRT